MRVYRSVADGRIDFDIEGAVQISNEPFASRTNNEFRNTPNIGYFVHAEIGRKVAKSRFSAMFDLASGRRRNYELIEGRPGVFGSTDDKVLEIVPTLAEFDPLFGTFDDNFGPEGLFGILAYKDILSGAIRFETEFEDRFAARLTYRASTRFSTNRTGSGGRDLNRNLIFSKISLLSSGVGHQLDANLHYWILPKKLKFEVGGAVFLQQTILQDSVFDTPQAGLDSDTLDRNTTLYGYSAISLGF